jgi:hypothetical protein
MATKKGASSGASKSPKKKPLTLKNLNDGQAKINGKFYKALDLIIDYLSKTGPKDALEQARKRVEVVPGIEPPGCLPPY